MFERLYDRADSHNEWRTPFSVGIAVDNVFVIDSDVSGHDAGIQRLA